LARAVTGSLNTTTINSGAAPSTACTDTNIVANITGDNNTLTNKADAKSTMTTNITGDQNQTTITSSTTNLLGARATVTEVGGQNTVNITQNGPAGANGFMTAVDLTGSSNTVGVTQNGTIDSNVNIKSVGSNNSITVTSGN